METSTNENSQHQSVIGEGLLIETSTNENSQHQTISSNDVDENHDNLVSDFPNNGGTESKHELAEEEVRGILEVIAATGRFWHEWDKLKSMLSFYLKQVLSKYSEAKMTGDQQNSSLGETYLELVKRLDDALQSFVEGPPFTLQRVCEILLTAENIYPNLSKLALALEKNLLVTSTLTISTDPYSPTIVQRPDEPEKGSEEPHLQSNSIQNGVEPMVGDRDEIMTEVEEANVDDDMTIDMETFQEIVGSSEANSVPTNDS
ncbi:hypothetical protein F0562_024706 [Nyssa sinensis]|uniref:Serine/threonine-protein phosphatase 4 regulatory subunit 2 n=1 Tax=Nyssa sinensis TaxID=561372 RepID=A0A5J5BB15_9ASTE|nr:hypothetical protein F0562_024706 [Nyssa sinensis]